MDPVDEAIVEQDGRIRLRSTVRLKPGAQVLVSMPQVGRDTAVSGLALSEHALAKD